MESRDIALFAYLNSFLTPSPFCGPDDASSVLVGCRATFCTATIADVSPRGGWCRDMRDLYGKPANSSVLGALVSDATVRGCLVPPAWSMRKREDVSEPVMYGLGKPLERHNEPFAILTARLMPTYFLTSRANKSVEL